MGRALLIRFAVGALVGVVAAVAVGAVVARPSIKPQAPEGFPVALTDPSGAPVDFRLVDGEATPLDPLPTDVTVTLTAFHGPGATTEPGGQPAQWWNTSVPRIPAISQFDGGPLQKVNCLMAATAMLARLGFGVVTTGSQVRALSGDTELGTTYQNAQDAIRKGWNVRFSQGALTPLQLRAVLYAGAGAIIDG